MKPTVVLIAALGAALLVSTPVDAAAADAPQLAGPDGTVVLVNVKKDKRFTYHRLLPDTELRLTAQGPARLELKVRRLLAAPAAEVAAAVLISVRDGVARAQVALPTKLATNYVLEGADVHLSRLGKLQLEVPPGVHSYALTVDAAAAPGIVLRARYTSNPSVELLVAETPLAPAPPAAAPTSPPPRAPSPPPRAPSPAPEDELRTIRVAVYALQGRDIETRIVAVTTNALVAELRKMSRVAAIGIDEIQDMLTHEESKQLLGCSDDSCLAEIAGAMGVDELITGSLARIGEASVINVRRLDLRRAESVGAVNRRLAASDGEEFLAAIGPLVETLYPKQPLRSDVTRGVAEEVALGLNPPPLPPWVFWTTASAALLVGAAGGVAAGLAKTKYDEYNEAFRDAGQTVVGNERLQGLRANAEAWEQAMLGLLISAGVLAVGAVVEAAFTNWFGYGEAADGLVLTPSAGPLPAGGVLAGGVLRW